MKIRKERRKISKDPIQYNSALKRMDSLKETAILTLRNLKNINDIESLLIYYSHNSIIF